MTGSPACEQWASWSAKQGVSKGNQPDPASCLQLRCLLILTASALLVSQGTLEAVLLAALQQQQQQQQQQQEQEQEQDPPTAVDAHLQQAVRQAASAAGLRFPPHTQQARQGQAGKGGGGGQQQQEQQQQGGRDSARTGPRMNGGAGRGGRPAAAPSPNDPLLSGLGDSWDLPAFSPPPDLS